MRYSDIKLRFCLRLKRKISFHCCIPTNYELNFTTPTSRIFITESSAGYVAKSHRENSDRKQVLTATEDILVWCKCMHSSAITALVNGHFNTQLFPLLSDTKCTNDLLFSSLLLLKWFVVIFTKGSCCLPSSVLLFVTIFTALSCPLFKCTQVVSPCLYYFATMIYKFNPEMRFFSFRCFFSLSILFHNLFQKPLG